jgi:antitoxin component YwqK of YwqJK toxin-antitoxin module
MACTRLILRTIGVLAILSAGWPAAGQPASRVPPAPGQATGSAPPKLRWRAPGLSNTLPKSTDQPIPVIDLAPAIEIAPSKETDLVTQRYLGGSPKIERQVAQDAEGNYVNHGTYTMYSADGKVLKKGQFRNGKMHGRWVQYFDRDEGNLFSAADNQFTGPFVSEATFEDGQLHGAWSIKTIAGRQIAQWSFDRGACSGKWTWWHSNGEKRREITYSSGTPDGEILEWGRDGKPCARASYLNGKHLTKTVEWYAPGQKHYEGYYLRNEATSEPSLDWWTGTAAATPAIELGPPQKHGLWTAWYPNGNKQVEGTYDRDAPQGKFTWWYESGEKQAEGEYRAGTKHGTWTTWHPSGMKESAAQYQEGALVGKWMLWKADGKLVETRDFREQGEPAARTARSASQKPVRLPDIQ